MKEKNNYLAILALAFSVLSLISTVFLYYVVTNNYKELNANIDTIKKENTNTQDKPTMTKLLNDFARKLINDNKLSKKDSTDNKLTLTYNEMITKYGLKTNYECIEEDTYITYTFYSENDNVKDILVSQNCYEK